MSALISIYEAIEYINENIADDITVDQCSENADLPTPEFIEQFIQVMGYSPYKYIKKLRLNLGTEAVMKQNKIFEFSALNGYKNREEEISNSQQEFVTATLEHQKTGIKCTIDELSDIEKIVAFLPAPKDREQSGNLYYTEHKEIYDELIKKGFFDKDTLDYRREAKELTKDYSYEYTKLILELIKTCSNLSEVYSKAYKRKPLPILLFYAFVKEMAVNGLLEATVFNEYKKCALCRFLAATLGDADFIREQVIQEHKDKNITISGNETYCLGLSSGKCATLHCPIEC